jgi:nitrite reductase/ring-hydroxylating ferredoxin subunit/uncharacterized membrane protein
MDREALLSRIEHSEALDELAGRLDPVARAVAGDPHRKGLLTGNWLGHPAHPMVMLAPLSCFVAATTLDLVGGRAGRRAARRLIGLGLVSSIPAAATGMADWTDTSGAERRMGAAHAAANTVALTLFALSWRQRGRGAGFRGVLSALAGTSLTGLAGYLGGHLAYRRGVGVDTTAFQSGPTEWRSLGRLDDLAEDRPVTATVDGVDLLVFRRHDSVWVLESRCPHRGGPLAEGDIADGCVTCPWHASTFELATGAVVDGPATAPARTYEVRLTDGEVQVRRLEVGGLRQVGASS